MFLLLLELFFRLIIPAAAPKAFFNEKESIYRFDTILTYHFDRNWPFIYNAMYYSYKETHEIF